MILSAEEISEEVGIRLLQHFGDLPFPPDVGRTLAQRLRNDAVEVRPWSSASLITVTPKVAPPYSVLNLDTKAHPPVVVYYRPIKAAQLIIALVAGVAGAANPVLVGLAVISGLFAIVDVRTAPSPSECLLFSILADQSSVGVERGEAKQRFAEIATQGVHGIEAEDFETSLHGLRQIGLIRDSGGRLEIADRMIMHLPR